MGAALDEVIGLAALEVGVAIEHRFAGPAAPGHDDSAGDALHGAVACPGVAEYVDVDVLVEAGGVAGTGEGSAEVVLVERVVRREDEGSGPCASNPRWRGFK